MKPHSVMRGRRWCRYVACACLLSACGQGTSTPTPEATTPPLEAAGAPAEIRASVDRAQATTGDIITYTVDVDHAQSVQVDVQEPGASIAGLRILDVGRETPVNAGARVREKRWYKLRADLVGSYVLPPVRATFHNTAKPDEAAQPLQSSEIFIEVKSVLATDGEVRDIEDIEPLEVVHKSLSKLWLVAAAGVLLAAAGGLVWWLRRRRMDAASAPPLPAHEQAFRDLNRLRKTNFEDKAAVRAYYFAISEVVRTYVEGRFGFNATDLTTEEIFGRLADVSALESTQRQHLRDFLMETDTVKYAARDADNTHIARTYEQALSFVEATRPVQAPPDASAAATPA